MLEGGAMCVVVANLQGGCGVVVSAVLRKMRSVRGNEN